MKLFSESGKHSSHVGRGRADEQSGTERREEGRDAKREFLRSEQRETDRKAPRAAGAPEPRPAVRRAPASPKAAPRPAGAPEEKGGRRKKKSFLLRFAIVLGIILLIVLAAIAIFEIWTTAPDVKEEGLISQGAETPVGETLPPAETATPAPTATASAATPTPTAKAAATGRRDNTYTVLVIGEDVAGMNTDTIMVAMLDTDAETLNVVSIPRDTLVNVDWSIKKVNTYYGQTGTEEGLVNGIADLIGYKVDNYVIVNVYAFEDVIDAVGGVYFDVPMHIEWGDPTIGRSYNISAGYQWLDGYNSLGVVRFRKNTDGSGYPTGDIGRIQTQQAFAVALIKQMLKLGNIPNLSKVVSILADNTKTNLTSNNMAFFAQEFLKLSSDDVQFHTAPYDPVYIKGGSYVSLRLSEWLDMLNEYLNPYYEKITESNLDVLTLSNDNFYSTTGVLAGGFDSFYDYTA